MVNCWVPVVERLTDDGCIDNCAECGEVTGAAWPPPQPTHVRLKKVTKINAKQLIADFFPCTDGASTTQSDAGLRIETIQGRYVFIYGTLILTPRSSRAFPLRRRAGLWRVSGATNFRIASHESSTARQQDQVGLTVPLFAKLKHRN
jgi:hypothetical protein